MAEGSPTARVQAWLRQNKGAAAATGGGALLGLFMLARRKATTSTSDPSVTVQSGGSPTPSVYGAAGYYDSTATDLYNAITPQLQGLQQQITAAGLTAGPVDSSTPEQGFFGVGYGPLTKESFAAGRADDPLESLSGDKYAWLPSGQAVKAAQSTGQATFYQPAPGIFSSTQGLAGAQWADTPIFVKG